MNQILVTGDEFGGQPKKQKQAKQPRQPKQRTVANINSIVIFFAISIIILGICMVSGSVYARTRINETVEANAKPTVEIIRDDEKNKIEIYVKHIRGITEIAYRWNENEEKVINGGNRTELRTELDLVGGTNILTVKVKEENGQTVSHQKTFTVANIPEIELQAVSNGVKVIATSENGIEYITYKWDNNEAQKIEVGQNNYEGIINVPKGKHTLTIEVIDEEGNKGTKTETIVGDTEPTLTLRAVRKEDNQIYFIVDAEDDEGTEKIEITFNGETETIDVNDKTYHHEIQAVSGENKIKVVVYNINGVQAIKGGRI